MANRDNEEVAIDTSQQQQSGSEKKAMYDHNSKDIDIAVQRLQDESMQQSDDEDATAEIASNNVQMEVDDEERGVTVSDDFTSDTDAEKRIKKQSKRKKKGKG